MVIPRGAAVAACAVAFVLRVVAGLALNVRPGGPRGFPFYGFIADNVVRLGEFKWLFYEGLGWKWANRAPIYPLSVAAVRSVSGSHATEATVVVQAAIGAAACLMPAWIALRWGGTRAAAWAVWIAALWPYSIVNDTCLVEQVLYAPAAMLVLLTTMRACDGGGAAKSALVGLACGVATLVRLTFAVSIPFVAAVVAWRRGLRSAAILIVAAGLAVSPWILRNAEVVGRPTLGTDGGRALWVSNAPSTFDTYPAHSIDDAEVHLLRTLPPETSARLHATAADEIAQDDLFRAMAVANIEAHPADVAWGGLRKAAAEWSLVHNPGPDSWAKLLLHALPFAALLVLACCGVATAPAVRVDLPVVLALLASFTAVAIVFWGQPRYLAPLHGIGIALAAATLAGANPRRAGAA